MRSSQVSLDFRTYSQHVENSPTKRTYCTCSRLHIAHKTQRWALRLAEFNFKVEHIPGAFNTWADLLTRWAAPGNEESPVRRLSALRVLPITADIPELPSVDVISKSQLPSPASIGRWFSLHIEPEKRHLDD